MTRPNCRTGSKRRQPGPARATTDAKPARPHGRLAGPVAELTDRQPAGLDTRRGRGRIGRQRRRLSKDRLTAGNVRRALAIGRLVGRLSAIRLARRQDSPGEKVDPGDRRPFTAFLWQPSPSRRMPRARAGTSGDRAPSSRGSGRAAACDRHTSPQDRWIAARPLESRRRRRNEAATSLALISPIDSHNHGE